MELSTQGPRGHGTVDGIVDEERLPIHTGERRPGIGRARVGGVVPGQRQRPVVVEELPREEEGLGVPVALGRVVAVVLVRGDRVQPEPAVRLRVDRQCVVMAHQLRFPGACDEQLGRERPVEGPEGERILERHVRVDPYPEAGRGVIQRWRAGNGGRVHTIIESAGTEFPGAVPVPLFGVPEAAVHARPCHRGYEEFLRVELVPPLVGVRLARRPPLRGRSDDRPV
jgi:hypothetical protein